MLKYIIIPLSENSESYCHYNAKGNRSETSFINPESLSAIICWAMKENLSVQFVYPDARMPEALLPIINSIDHINIVPDTCEDTELINNADIIVSNNLNRGDKKSGKIYILRINFSDLTGSVSDLENLIANSIRVNVVMNDIQNFSKESIASYRSFLQKMSDFIVTETVKGNNVQFNLITDRMMLSGMNNCNAGHESIVASSDGTLYPCPAFIGDERFKCGDIRIGFEAPNQRLFQISNAPICKVCDAFQCKRCVWLNHSLTHEVNTPGWQQCIIAHLEREASRKTLNVIRKQFPDYLIETEITEIDYNDPFTIVKKL